MEYFSFAYIFYSTGLIKPVITQDVSQILSVSCQVFQECFSILYDAVLLFSLLALATLRQVVMVVCLSVCVILCLFIHENKIEILLKQFLILLESLRLV